MWLPSSAVPPHRHVHATHPAYVVCVTQHRAGSRQEQKGHACVRHARTEWCVDGWDATQTGEARAQNPKQRWEQSIDRYVSRRAHNLLTAHGIPSLMHIYSPVRMPSVHASRCAVSPTSTSRATETWHETNTHVMSMQPAMICMHVCLVVSLVRFAPL